MNRTRKMVGPDMRMVIVSLVTTGVMIAAISVIDSSLFFNKAFGQNATSPTTANQPLQNLLDKVKPALEHIDQAIDALRNNDSSKALDEVNLADTELFKITQNLTTSEE
jgi:hypothetical protein